MFRMLHFWLLLGLFLLPACGGKRQLTAYPPPHDPLPAFLAPARKGNPEKYESVAFRLFNQSDYIRALRSAYQAVSEDPDTPRPAFLLGLIYDVGFNRPGLAILEYTRALHLYDREALSERLQPRLQYLHRNAYRRLAETSLREDNSLPLSGHNVAVFPFWTEQSRPGVTNLAPGLLDLLIYDLSQIPSIGPIDPLKLHILSDIFQKSRPASGAAEFAHWAGAHRTVSGTLIALGDHKVQFVLQIFNPNGDLFYESLPLKGNLWDLKTFRQLILNEVARGLEVTLPSRVSTLPVSSPLTLTLHAEGLRKYISGQVAEAFKDLSGALMLDPDSKLITHSKEWVEQDLKGQESEKDLVFAYTQLVTQPDPLEARESRLEATHRLSLPLPGIQSGTESLDPYKPPRPDRTP